MRRILLIVMVASLAATVKGQDTGELDNRYGFKDIRLESSPDSVKGVKLIREFKERDEFPAKLYSVDHESYARIGEVKIRGIELKAFKDMIYEITVTAEKDVRLMKALESIYGKAEYDLKNETWFWKGRNVILKFRSAGRNQLQLQYTSYPVYKRMKEEKDKKLEDIANDF